MTKMMNRKPERPQNGRQMNMKQPQMTLFDLNSHKKMKNFVIRYHDENT